MSGRITPKAPYGQHIKLICKNHPHLSWSTKNIGGSNADGTLWTERSVFFSGDGRTPECDCPIRDLRTAPELAELPDVSE